jgi:hypothetical protein
MLNQNSIQHCKKSGEKSNIYKDNVTADAYKITIAEFQMF